jgi:hypothetical protein
MKECHYKREEDNLVVLYHPIESEIWIDEVHVYDV